MKGAKREKGAKGEKEQRGVKGSEGSEGIIILGFRVPTTSVGGDKARVRRSEGGKGK